MNKAESLPAQWRGDHCAEALASSRVAATAAEWEELWRAIGRPAPPADLDRNFAVAVFLGPRSTGGFSVAFAEPSAESGSCVVRCRIVKPAGLAPQVLTRPYAVKLFAKAGRPAQIKTEVLGD